VLFVGLLGVEMFDLFVFVVCVEMVIGVCEWVVVWWMVCVG